METLYNIERPHSFSAIRGQEGVIQILVNDIRQGNYKPAYLFTGVRGTGKTTIARIIAESINCSHPLGDGSPCGECASCKEIREHLSMDVIELDAASNNSVENIRQIIEQIQYRPIYKKKVIILDECHMLSTAACNALLKVLEEPPSHVTFILCTTEMHKILPTIKSRCSCYTFEKIALETIASHIADVCNKHGMQYEPAAMQLIAKAAKGSMRDALSILDKYRNSGLITADMVVSDLGLAPDEVVFSILHGITAKNPSAAITALKTYSAKGGNLACLIEEVFSVVLDMVAYVEGNKNLNLILGTSQYKSQIAEIASVLTIEDAFRILDELRTCYQLKGEDIEFSVLSAIVSVIHTESQLVLLKKEVQELRAIVSQNGSIPSQNIPSAETSNVTVPIATSSVSAPVVTSTTIVAAPTSPVAPEQPVATPSVNSQIPTPMADKQADVPNANPNVPFAMPNLCAGYSNGFVPAMRSPFDNVSAASNDVLSMATVPTVAPMTAVPVAEPMVAPTATMPVMEPLVSPAPVAEPMVIQTGNTNKQADMSQFEGMSFEEFVAATSPSDMQTAPVQTTPVQATPVQATPVSTPTQNSDVNSGTTATDNSSFGSSFARRFGFSI